MKKYCSFILLSLLFGLAFFCPVETFAQSSTIQHSYIPIEGIIGRENNQKNKMVEESQNDKIETLPKLGSEREASQLLSIIGVILILIVVSLKYIWGGAYEKK